MPPQDQGLAELYADVAPDLAMRARAASLGSGGLREQLTASTRPDMAGVPLNMLLHPTTYQQKVAGAWSAYNTDPFFARMINRTVDFAANGAKWEVPAPLEEKSWIEMLQDWFSGKSARADREEDFWNAWAGQVNRGVPNIIPGLQEVVRWAARHLLLSGMFVPHWEWGEIPFGKQTYLVPTRITCYPASAIALRRPQQLFVEEEIFYAPPGGMKNAPLREGQNAIASGVATGKPLPAYGTATKSGDTEVFGLKYNFTPGDLVTIRHGQFSGTGFGLYPQVPCFSLMSQFLIRQKLFASDLSILDGIINYILQWKIGDKDHAPQAPQLSPDGKTVIQEGTVAQVRRLIQEGRVGPALELFLPYYVDLVIKMPDTSVLLSEAKYAQSTIEIFQFFGIFFARGSGGSRERMERINVGNYEEMLAGLRWHINALMDLLVFRIMQMNPGKLKRTPIWSPNPLNTKNDAFMTTLIALAKMGKVSHETLMRYQNLDSGVEVRRIARELATDIDDLTNANAPVSYVQSTEPPDYGGSNSKGKPAKGKPAKETAINPAKQPGRPTKLEGEE